MKFLGFTGVWPVSVSGTPVLNFISSPTSLTLKAEERIKELLIKWTCCYCLFFQGFGVQRPRLWVSTVAQSVYGFYPFHYVLGMFTWPGISHLMLWGMLFLFWPNLGMWVFLTCVSVHVGVVVRILMCMCVCFSVCVLFCVCGWVCLSAFVCICLFLCLCLCVHVCVDRNDPYADPYYDYEMEALWRGGQYENFRVEYSETPLPYHYAVSTLSYDSPLVIRYHL